MWRENAAFFITWESAMMGFNKGIFIFQVITHRKRMEIRMEKKYWEGKEFSFFSHKRCEYFPCHKNADPENFNCLFCYCPLYMLGDKCGGNFRFTEKGIKDCTACMLPHKRENYGYVTGKYCELLKIMKDKKE